jgi:glycosylphosphatidylinositol transamidase (GPIT) subunit GPI8
MGLNLLYGNTGLASDLKAANKALDSNRTDSSSSIPTPSTIGLGSSSLNTSTNKSHTTTPLGIPSINPSTIGSTAFKPMPVSTNETAQDLLQNLVPTMSNVYSTGSTTSEQFTGNSQDTIKGYKQLSSLPTDMESSYNPEVTITDKGIDKLTYSLVKKLSKKKSSKLLSLVPIKSSTDMFTLHSKFQGSNSNFIKSISSLAKSGLIEIGKVN